MVKCKECDAEVEHVELTPKYVLCDGCAESHCLDWSFVRWDINWKKVFHNKDIIE